MGDTYRDYNLISMGDIQADRSLKVTQVTLTRAAGTLSVFTPDYGQLHRRRGSGAHPFGYNRPLL